MSLHLLKHTFRQALLINSVSLFILLVICFTIIRTRVSTPLLTQSTLPSQFFLEAILVVQTRVVALVLRHPRSAPSSALVHLLVVAPTTPALLKAHQLALVSVSLPVLLFTVLRCSLLPRDIRREDRFTEDRHPSSTPLVWPKVTVRSWPVLVQLL